MVAMPTPFEAYRLDLGRLGVDEDLCAADSMWLLIAHCLTRFADQPETGRLDLAQRCAQALEQFAATAQEPADDIVPLDDSSLGELNRLIQGLQNFGDRAGQEQVAKVVLDLSARMAGLGALTLAHTTVGHARGAVYLASERTRGLLLAEQARVMRLLGHLDEAEVMYAQLHAIGERGRDDLLLARAAIGRGVVARVRGNYPKARQFFADALDLSERAKSHELQRLAHQGLTIAAAVSEDWDEALRHGWLTLVHGAGNSEQECEALINLSHVSLEAGYARAALHAVLRALPNATDDHTRLPALGTAVVSAARCGERSMLDCLAVKLEATVAVSSLPYESGRSLLSLARAFDEVGMRARAETIRERARAIAEQHQFHELLHVAETDELTRPVTAIETRELDTETQQVVANLEALEFELVV